MLNYKSYVALILIIFNSAICGGCGYGFKSQSEPHPIKSLAIPLMTGTSTEKGFEADFTGIIRNEFISHAKVLILPKEEAQTILKGHIHEVRREPVSYRREPYLINDQQSYYETTNTVFLKIKLDIRLVDRTTGKVIWHERDMEERARYSVGTDPIANRYGQQQALLKIARAFAKRVYLKTMERF